MRGTIHPVGDRFGIGRAGGASLQLVDEAVSRQHAHLARDERGHTVLIDLLSTNGTFIDGRRIQRELLRPHSVVTIAGTELVFEPAAEAPPTSEVLRGDERVAVSLRGPNGVEHGGHLLDEIIEYRRLRADDRRGGQLAPADRERLSDLADRLRQPPTLAEGDPPGSERRAFWRFSCSLPVVLRTSAGAEIPGELRDLGVDGAQLHAPDHGVEYDEIVWLGLVLEAAGQAREQVLAARVAWADGDLLGLAFAGAPRSRHYERPGPVASREALDDDAPTVKMMIPRGATEDLAPLIGSPHSRGRHWSRPRS
ncbi:MAG: FHA domain-containing protein [Myxococcales bacterium]|nr:FHA domain-containing protein [Myxococcales bacterium]MCB9716389.1 FHA domain-containing protein [Myxococcales bacterium]